MLVDVTHALGVPGQSVRRERARLYAFIGSRKSEVRESTLTQAGTRRAPLPEFCARHPHLLIEVVASNRGHNLLDSSIDAAMR